MHVIQWPQGVKDAADFFARAGQATGAADFEALLKAAAPQPEPEREGAGARPPLGAGDACQITMTPTGFVAVYAGRRYECQAIEQPNPARLKATVKAVAPTGGGGCGSHFHIDTVDFYLSRHRRVFIGEVARLLREKVEVIEADMNRLIGQLEAYAQKRAENTQTTIESTIKNPLTGTLTTQVNTVHGPTAVFQTTTRPDIDAETRSRFIITSVDESPEQTRAILEAQRNRHTLEGLRRKKLHEAIIKRHHAFQRLLKPLPVVNPFEPLLSYAEDRLAVRRDNPKYLNLILAVTFLHQMQRPVKHDAETGQDYLETTLTDIAIANQLATALFGQTLDELSRPSRELLKLIRKMVDGLEKADRQRGAKIMVGGGANIAYAQLLLGHRSLRTTQVYTRVSVPEIKVTHAETHPRKAEPSPQQVETANAPLESLPMKMRAPYRYKQ